MTISEKLRLVQGLHSHAEMFGFNWNDDSDWTWHDVACKIADEIDAENAKLRELVRFIMHQCNDGNPRCDECIGWNGGECVALTRMRELGVDV